MCANILQGCVQIIPDSHKVRAALCERCAARKLATVKVADTKIGEEARDGTGIPSGSQTKEYLVALSKSIAGWLRSLIPDIGGGTLPPNAFEVLAVAIKRLAPRADIISERRIPSELTTDNPRQMIIDHQLRHSSTSELTIEFLQKVLTTVQQRDFASQKPENARKYLTPHQ